MFQTIPSYKDEMENPIWINKQYQTKPHTFTWNATQIQWAFYHQFQTELQVFRLNRAQTQGAIITTTYGLMQGLLGGLSSWRSPATDWLSTRTLQHQLRRLTSRLLDSMTWLLDSPTYWQQAPSWKNPRRSPLTSTLMESWNIAHRSSSIAILFDITFQDFLFSA